jgi:hypothetical protein
MSSLRYGAASARHDKKQTASGALALQIWGGTRCPQRAAVHGEAAKFYHRLEDKPIHLQSV